MIIEYYSNKLYRPDLQCCRWTVDSEILVGGSISDAADWVHIRDDLGYKAVVNVETEHSDEGKGIDYLIERRVPDDGSRFPLQFVRDVVDFAYVSLVAGRKVYVHCQGGGSRSPAFAYAILRTRFTATPEDALNMVRNGKTEEFKAYGSHAYHKAYLGSVEEAINGWRPPT
jgi:protein-tyrosine phosphatase